MSVRLQVNGEDVELDVDDDVPLLYVLRNDLGLKGTRFGCGHGMCGACTVLVEGRPTTACDTPVSAVVGQPIQTIEGLAGPDGLHPLQQAFLDEQAGQCGYCLTGVLLAAKALLDRTPHPSRDVIHAALDANLCRCGTHERFVRAIERAAAAAAQVARP